MTRHIVVQATVACPDESLAQRSVEALSRVVTGLALEGLVVQIGVQTVDVEDDE